MLNHLKLLLIVGFSKYFDYMSAGYKIVPLDRETLDAWLEKNPKLPIEPYRRSDFWVMLEQIKSDSIVVFQRRGWKFVTLISSMR